MYCTDELLRVLCRADSLAKIRVPGSGDEGDRGKVKVSDNKAIIVWHGDIVNCVAILCDKQLITLLPHLDN